MSDVAIRCEGIGKRYRIGKRMRYKALRDTIADAAALPFRAAARLLHPGRAPDAEQGGDFWALKDVTFDIHRGEVVGLIGRNGAGKSTLLKILSRITEPTEGRATLHGRVGSLLEVGTGFHPELTGRENISLNGAILGMKRHEIARRFDAIVAFAEIEQFLDTPVKHYSSGMYMRLAFSVAAHLEPEILLVDEVLAVGDSAFQKKCLGKMGEVAHQGRTVVLVSHNMHAIRALSSRVVLLERGRVVLYGDRARAVEAYIGMSRSDSGEMVWTDRSTAPGDQRARLHAVRVLVNGEPNGSPDVESPIDVAIEYWNLEPGARRTVSIHLSNSMGYKVFTTANMRSGNIEPDPWCDRSFPAGLYRTTCRIPSMLLNPGVHAIDLFINAAGASDTIILLPQVLSFEVVESQRLRSDYLGEWIGAVRPALAWHTEPLAPVAEPAAALARG